MNTRLSLFFAGVTLLICPTAYSQTADQNCLDEIIAIYAHVSDLTKNIGDRHIRFVFRSHIVMKDSTGRPSRTTNAETILSRNCIQTVSRDAEFYQDSLSTIAVIPSSKIIYYGDGLMRDKNGKIIKRDLLQLQDSLLHRATVISCRNLVGGYKQVILAGNNNHEKKFPYQSMEFIIHPDTKQLKKITVLYHPYSKIHRVTYEFLELNTNYISKRSGAQVADKVFDDAGRLKKEYSTYKVIDSRTTNSLATKK